MKYILPLACIEDETQLCSTLGTFFKKEKKRNANKSFSSLSLSSFLF